jgi:hypothetical protein
MQSSKKFKTGDRVVVQNDPILPKDIVGFIGTVNLFNGSVYVVLDNDPKEQGIQRYFGENTKSCTLKYLTFATKLHKILA